MIKKDIIADVLDEISKTVDVKTWMTLSSIVKELRRKEPVRITPVSEAGEKPDWKYMIYPLKTSWHMKYSDGLRAGTNWTAGWCYELPDGTVQIWCSDFIYEYDSISDTHDWDLD